VRSLLLTPPALTRLAERCDLRAHTVFVADQRTVNAVVGFDLHRGAIAVAERPAPRSLAEVVAGARRLVVLEGINDAENLGAIARSARGLGADGLVLDPTCADPYYRRAVRVSMGEVLHLPIARAPLAAVFEALDAGGFHTWALTPRRDATPIGRLVAGGVPERLALVFGAEGPGLSDTVLATRTNVRIPQRADVDSLNVGHATAAALAIVASSAP
jgi:tRNA G18 (ribose-2'-O)-methylase SpoU